LCPSVGMKTRHTTFRRATRTSFSSTSSVSSPRQSVAKALNCGDKCLLGNRGNLQQLATSQSMSTFATIREVLPLCQSLQMPRRRTTARLTRPPIHQREDRRSHRHQRHQHNRQRMHRRRCPQRIRRAALQREFSRLRSLVHFTAALDMTRSWMTVCAKMQHRHFLCRTPMIRSRIGIHMTGSFGLEVVSYINL
jgi:hypothetical protein